MRRILVPYRFTEPLAPLAAAWTPDTAVVVARGEPGETAARIHEHLAARVAETAATETIVVVAGDAVIGSAVVAGLQRRGEEPSVLWLSAFPALHTPQTTTPASRGLDGVALAIVLGWTGTALTARSGARPVDAHRIALVDARAIDDAERAIAVRDHLALLDVAELASGALPPPPWSVHVDYDLFDPGDVPALRNPIPGGPPAAEVGAALRALHGRGRIAALTIAVSLTSRALAAPDPLAVVRMLTDALGNETTHE